MLIEVEVAANGVLKVSPNQHQQGTKILFNAETFVQDPVIGTGDWNSIQEALSEFDTLNIPRRSPIEILDDSHTFRETK